MLPVGIPKEIKIGERRVGLTPNGVGALTQRGAHVFVESGAGLLSGFENEDYRKAGAELISDRRTLWQKAVLIKKVKEPIAEELSFFESKHIIFTYLHLASPAERPLIDALCSAKATAIAYETIEKDGSTPLLKPMSEIAGTLSAYFAGVFCTIIQIKSGHIFGIDQVKTEMLRLASEYPRVPKNLSPGRVVILGGGHVGKNAAKMARQMGARVFLSEVCAEKRLKLTREFELENLEIHLLNPETNSSYEDALASSEVIIGAVHSAGKRAPMVIDSAMLKRISDPKKKIILDVAIDQGGNVAESRVTNYDTPLYLDSFGNLRFSVTNIPSLCGRGASEVLEQVSLAYTLALSRGGLEAINEFPELDTGVNILNGTLVNRAVREAHGFIN